MGESTTFQCATCGYESPTIRWGVGMSDPRQRFMPAECLSCRSYVEVDLTGVDLLVDQLSCSSCGAPVFFLEKAETYACPRCASHHVHLRQGPGYW